MKNITLKDGDIICFLGDSITANGLWMAEVYQVLRKEYRIKCYNCGVAGASAYCALEYLQSECLRYNPDYVCVMFGMNDINRLLYADSIEKTIEIRQQKQEAIQCCINSYEQILKEIKNSGAVAIICIPTPYDEVSDSPEINLKCQSGLDELSTLLLELAIKYDSPVVNFQATMQPILGKRLIISPDRVHPTEEGYHVMAQTFLWTIGVSDGLAFDGAFVFEDWNRARYEAEKKLELTNLVEYCIFNSERRQRLCFEEKKKIALKNLEEIDDGNSLMACAYREYLERIDKRAQLIDEVDKLTL